MVLKKVLFVFSICMMVMMFSGGAWAEKAVDTAVDAVDTGKVVKININTATAEELTRLKNIGPKIAERIIVYREKQGAFKHPEEIKNVKGIGEKVYELNKALIAVK